MAPDTLIVISACEEAARIEATLAALKCAFPGATIVLGDDGSRDITAALAQAAGAEVVSGPHAGKGANATRAAQHALALGGRQAVYLLCDGDLAQSAAALRALTDAVHGGEADLVIAAFARRVGGGFGLAVGFARYAIRKRCGLQLRAPISGQRALTGEALNAVLPFAPNFAMEIGMTIDAQRAGLRVKEIDLDLEHRATGRTLRGFLHRARQLTDFVRVYVQRR